MVVLIACAIAGSLAILLLDLLMLLLTAFLGLSVVSFIIMAMMAFSSLQKQRAGGNAPLAMMLGVMFKNNSDASFVSQITGIALIFTH